MVRDMWRADMDVLRAQWKESMHAELLDSAYGSMSYAAGVPTSDALSGKRKTRYCVDGSGVSTATGDSRRRGDWAHTRYWEHLGEAEVLTDPEQEFRNLTRIPRHMFDDILLKAAQSGRFPISRYEPIAKKLPRRAGRCADHLVCPLAIKIMGALRHLATGEPFRSIELGSNVGCDTIRLFFHQFTAWFVETYYAKFVVEQSGTGFDSLAEVQAAEALFRQMGLPGLITSMDGT